MKLATRARVAASLVLGIVAVATVATATVYPSPAYAAGTTFTGSGNLTVLPSTSAPLFSGVADASPAGTVGQYLYAASKDPKKLAALTALYKQAQAGTATAAETAELATAVRAAAPVATRTALLTRGVASAAGGPVGLALTSAQVGFMVGGGVSRAMGMDVDGTLCRGDLGGKALAFVSGTDCGSFWETVNKGQVNEDVQAGTVGSTVCATDGGCAKFTGSIKDSYGRPYQQFKNSSGATTRSGSIYSSSSSTVYMVMFYTDPGYGPNAAGQSSFADPAKTKPYYDFCGDVDACGYVQPCAVQGCKGAPDFISTITGYQWYDYSTEKFLGQRGTLTTGTGDPKRFQKCQQSYKSGRVDTVSGDSRALSEGMPVMPDLPAPTGDIVTKITCELISEDGTAEPVKDFEQETTPEYQKSAAVNPECGSTTVCELQLVKPDGSVCNDTDNTCAGWSTAADKDQYTCRFGNEAIGFRSADITTECAWYADRWTPEAQRTGNTLTAPATQSPSKTATTIPNPAPELTPGTDKNVGSAPIKDPDTGRAECFPSGWGALNPVSWVVQPVQCALSWAFVPRLSEVKKAGDGIRKSWDKTAPVKLATAVGGWDFEPVMTGCDGIPIPKDLIYKGMPAQRIASACAGTSLAPAATAVKVFLNITFGIGGAWAIASYMGWTIGFKGPAD